MKKDIYDEAVAFFGGEAEKMYVESAWAYPKGSKGGVLFLFCSDSGGPRGARGECCGCLTDVKCGILPAQLKSITDAIRKDERLPSSSVDITKKSLPVFAEWQRRLDKAFPGRRKSVSEIARESIQATRRALKARKRKEAV